MFKGTVYSTVQSTVANSIVFDLPVIKKQCKYEWYRGE